MQFTNDLLEKLLLKDEDTSLDFKREMYLFNGANDNQKSELLKDILAFANSWRDEDAYIIIGVHKNKSGTVEIVELNQSVDDAQIQQFVNSKTQRPIQFSYKNLPIKADVVPGFTFLNKNGLSISKRTMENLRQTLFM